MAREMILKCDKCKLPKEGVRPYKIVDDSRAWDTDLCPEDAQPLLAIAQLGREVNSAPASSRTLRDLEGRIRGVE